MRTPTIITAVLAIALVIGGLFAANAASSALESLVSERIVIAP